MCISYLAPSDEIITFLLASTNTDVPCASCLRHGPREQRAPANPDQNRSNTIMIAQTVNVSTYDFASAFSEDIASCIQYIASHLFDTSTKFATQAHQLVVN
jgi:hypothetical protein